MKVTWNNQVGWYSSWYDDSSYNSWHELHGRYQVDRCGTSTAPSSSGIGSVYFQPRYTGGDPRRPHPPVPSA